MSFLPLDEFPALFPHIEAWVVDLQTQVLEKGLPLEPDHARYARVAGVRHPEKIRVLAVDKIPRPPHPRVKELAERVGLLNDNTQGLTVGYGILVCSQCLDDLRLMVHEFAHVAQYERLGISEFLQQYIVEIDVSGYLKAALELEANAIVDEVCGRSALE
jgi:hypothetical protein